ncbi:hypothetical protein CDAR_242161 [Caerostris darwini]|uniref:Secreted protein n=1 Tax=Caerostris darwini TaxID=1538125 RepID=A0AAV4NM22_9ARAC|nr:hypothetical protein CDAR_242161 [Caerostris darwini]
MLSPFLAKSAVVMSATYHLHSLRCLEIALTRAPNEVQSTGDSVCCCPKIHLHPLRVAPKKKSTLPSRRTSKCQKRKVLSKKKRGHTWRVGGDEVEWMAGMIGRRLSARYFRYLTLVKRSHKHLMQHVRAARHFTSRRSFPSPRALSRRERHRLSSRMSNLPCTKSVLSLRSCSRWRFELHSVVDGGSSCTL